MPHPKEPKLVKSSSMNVLAGEQILFSVHPHIFPTLVMIATVVGIAAVFYEVLRIVGTISYAPFYITTIYWMAVVYIVLILLLEYFNTVYRVSNIRLQIKSGIIGSRVRAIDIDQVETVSVDQHVWGTLFNYGTVTIESAAAQLSLSFKHIPDPKVKAGIIDEQA